MAYRWGYKQMSKNQERPIWHKFPNESGRWTYSKCGKRFSPNDIVMEGYGEEGPWNPWDRTCKRCRS